MDESARILIAEDDDFLRASRRIYLEQAGYRVDTVSNGEEALQRLNELEFDIDGDTMNSSTYLGEQGVSDAHRLQQLLLESSELHRHLCPRQVLGVRTGMLAGRLLHLDLPQTTKRLLTIVETDGCYADGVSVATNCWVGRRTLRVEDYGKAGATFVDTQTETALRIVPSGQSRDLAPDYALEAGNRWEAMLLGYQRMPDDELFRVEPVALKTSVAALISRPGVHAICCICGEEIINEREVVRDGEILCRPCAGESYYRPLT